MEKNTARNKWVLCMKRTFILLQEFHECNLHPGVNRMQKLLGNLVTWQGMMREIRQYVRSCHVCQITKQKPCKFVGPLQAIIPSKPGDLVATDVLGPLIRSMYGYTCILVVVDVFSKFTKLYGLRRATSTTYINKIRQYVEKYGRPDKILSDNGPQFSSRKWKKEMLELGIREVHTAVRNPRGNPCERYIKIVGVCLRIVCGDKLRHGLGVFLL